MSHTNARSADRAAASARRGERDATAPRKGDRVVATNRRALHDYHVEERLEAGLVLTGSEVKSLRDGKAQLADAYAAADGGDLWLHHLHISPYDPANRFNHEPTRRRRLLLHKREIRRLVSLVERKGMTLIPLDLHFVRGYAKVTIGVARGKKTHDKRQAIAERDAARDVRRALRERSRSGE